MTSTPGPTGAAAPDNVAPSSVLAARIAVVLDGSPPSVDDLGLSDGKRLAFEWQQQRSHAWWNDLHGAISGRPGGRWVLETHGILGVVAEQVLISIEAEVEKAICRAALDTLPATSNLTDEAKAGRRAHYSRSLRFYGEGQANATVVGLHGLANLVVRSLEFDRPLDTAELKTLHIADPADFAPGSVAKKAWLSLEPATVTRLGQLAAGRSPKAQVLVAALQGIRNDHAIEELFELRNTQYHRWRGESAGVTGIAHGMTTASEHLIAKRAVSFGPELLPAYRAGDVALEELTRASRAALDAFVGHMEPFRSAWWALFEEAFVLP